MRRALPLAGVLAAAAALSGWALAAVVLALLAIAAGLCWVISDAGRADRLALLIIAARGMAHDGAQQDFPGVQPRDGRRRQQHHRHSA